ncbi:hypothetical protein AcW1_005999 [Taiwanofungus camphoratus]|nr:hypothetical protein AcW1_005999 [Antrodia cinnamomea]
MLLKSIFYALLRPTSHKIVLNVCDYSDKKVYLYMNTVGVTAANDELAGGRSGRQRMSAPGSRAGGVEAGLAKLGLEDLDLALLGDRREPTHAYLAAHTGLGARNVAITRPSGAPVQASSTEQTITQAD